MSTDDHNGHEIRKIENAEPVVWTPEDASRFLTSAIHEAQRPLADALKQRPITSRALALLVGVIVVAGLAIALILASQLEKAERRADVSQDKHETTLIEKHELQTSHATLQDRLASVTDSHAELRDQVDNLKTNEDAHRRARTDLSKFRRHNDALRSQITGLEMEKSALARQLEALKAMMAEPEEEEADHFDDPFDSGEGFADFDAPDESAPAGEGAAEAVEGAVGEASEPVRERVSETSSIDTAAPPVPESSVAAESAAPESRPEARAEEPEPQSEPEAASEPEPESEPESPAPEESELSAPEEPAPSEPAEETPESTEESKEESKEESTEEPAEEQAEESTEGSAGSSESSEGAAGSPESSGGDQSALVPDKYHGIASESEDDDGAAVAITPTPAGSLETIPVDDDDSDAAAREAADASGQSGADDSLAISVASSEDVPTATIDPDEPEAPSAIATGTVGSLSGNE